MIRNHLILVLILVFSCSCSLFKNTNEISNPSSEGARGLDGLSSYHASLTYAFSGSISGQSSNWSHIYNLTSNVDTETRLLEYSESGLERDFTAYPSFEGFQEGIYYYKNTPSDPCFASFIEDEQIANPPLEPANLLPIPQSLEEPDGTEMINGIETLRYKFGASAITSESTAQGTGVLWTAVDGGYIVKYSFALTGGEEIFFNETLGTLSWEYQLEVLDETGSTLLPTDCPFPLPEIPVMQNAVNLSESPGSINFEISGSVQDVVDFYRNNMSGFGFIQGEDDFVTENFALLSFTKNSQTIQIFIESGETTTVNIASIGISAPLDELSVQPTQEVGTSQSRVISSLDLLLGQGSTPPAFTSYQLEYTIVIPVWSGGAILPSTEILSADVENQNVHFSDNLNGTRTEAYLIEGQEYDVTDNQIMPGFGLAGMAWIMWPMDLTAIIAIGSYQTDVVGTDLLDGRTVEVYKISGSLADDPSGMLAGLGLNITRTDGMIWVDQLTGGMIKAVINFDMEVKDESGIVHGTGPGQIDLLVTSIGEIRVELP